METPDKADSISSEWRVAQSQLLFRAVNERIKPLNEAFSIVNHVNDFVCECAVEACTQPIRMSIEEYEAVRETGNRFAVAPDDLHVSPDVERIVERHDRYWVVENIGHAGEAAAQLDPRSRQSGEGEGSDA